MKRNTLLALCLLGLLAATAAAQPPPPTPADPPRTPLRAMIELQEVFDRGGRGPESLPLAFGIEGQDVDINSTIRIDVSAQRFREALRLDPAVTARLSPEARELLAISDKLEEAADFMKQAVADGRKLARMAADGQRDTPAFAALARGDQAQLRRTFDIYKEYFAFLAASSQPGYPARGAAARAAADQAILEGRLALASLLLEEVDWTVRELEQAGQRIANSPPSLALVLAAVHLRDGEPVELALPGYSTIPEGERVRFEKLNLVPSPQDLAEIERLRGEAQGWADLLDEVRDGGKSIEDALKEVLAAQDLGFAELKAAFDQVAADLSQLEATDWKAVGDDLEARLREALEGSLDDAQRQLLEGTVAGQVERLVRDLKVFRLNLVDLAAAVRGLAELVSGAAEQAEDDPFQALMTLLVAVEAGKDLVSGAETLFKDLEAGIASWRADAISLEKALAELEGALAGLGAELRQKFQEILETTARAHLGPLATDLAALKTATGTFVAKVKALGKASDLARLAAAADIEPPDTSFDVPLDQVRPTHLDLQTVNPRQEGEGVILRAWLYRTKPAPDDPQTRVRGEEVDQVSQRLQMLRFGWFTAPSVGLTFLSAADRLAGQEDETQGFVPQVSWMFNHRSWRRDGASAARYRPRWHDHIGFGVHTVTLDLDNDNQLEMGLGVTVSFFKDYFQLGFGIDLSLDQEPYYFIGTRLFQLAKGLGVKKQAAAPGD